PRPARCRAQEIRQEESPAELSILEALSRRKALFKVEAATGRLYFMTTRHRKPGQDRLFRLIEGSKPLITSYERPLPARMRGNTSSWRLKPCSNPHPRNGGCGEGVD